MVKHVLIHMDDEVHAKAKKILADSHLTWEGLIERIVS
jgi:hypothetical protein